jgi:coatomer protein complex subunit gamma
LQLFLGSGKPVYRFAAVRTLSQVALKHPMSVTKCNEDMETMIQDSNRSIATLAITTLLKTGGESSVDRLMKQISSFMSEIGDEFKVVIVKAIKVLCLKYPSKHRSMLAFLHNALREEGGFQFKKAIVDAILDLLNQVPEMKIEGLNALGEFIEDCEFAQLSVKILQLLGELAPTTPHPGRYIRFIYNRVILEIPPVRAAAVSALAKLAASVDELRDEVLILLRRAQTDDDDEVRDRATSYVTMLSAKDNVEASLNIIKDGLPSGMSVRALEKALIAYKARPAPGPLSIESLNVQLGSTSERGYEDERVERTTSLQEDAGIIEVDDNAGADNAAADVVDDNYAAELYNIPEFAGLGTLLKSSMPVKLTEDEVEYTVQCIKHTFSEHMVLQFNVNNTIDDQLLKNVQVALELEEEEVWSIHATVACEKIPFGKPDKCYVCLLRNEEYGSDSFDAVSFPCELRFTTHDVDKSTGEMIDEDDEGYAEEFPFEDVEIGPADFMARVNVGNFRSAWEQIGNSAEKTDKLALRQFKTIGDAVAAIIDALGMQPCEGTASVPSEAMKHMLMLGGSFCGNNKVLARVQLVVDSKNGGVLIKMGVRSEDEEVTNIVFSCL